MDDATGAERQLYILSLLSQNNKGYTLNQIIDNLQRLGVTATRRIVSRDMDSISRNFYVYEEEIGGVIFYKAKNHAVSNMDLTMPQIISLYYARELLGGSNSKGLAADAVKIFDTILTLLPRLSRTALTKIEKMIKIKPVNPQQDDPVDPNIFIIIQNSLMSKKSVDLTYAAFSSGKTNMRRFDPYIMEVSKGAWHLIGFCHLRQCIRDLRLSRIINAIPTDNYFSMPINFYDEYKKTRFDALAGVEPVLVRIEFIGNAARIVKEYHKGKADYIEEYDKHLIFIKKAALTEDFIQWILSFGEDAKVLEPMELINKITDIIEKMRSRYREDY